MTLDDKVKAFLSVSNGYGSGSGNGYGYGDGSGYGSGDGYGDGSGDGIKSFNGEQIYRIEGVNTLIHSVLGNIAHGAILNGDTAAAFAENCGATFVAKKLRDSTAFPEVVTRCKDCKYSCKDGNGRTCEGYWYELSEYAVPVKDDAFCSYGEPKEGTC